MALEDLYGINKGEAQIIDFGIPQRMAEEREVQRRLNAENTARKAKKMADVNEMLGKLHVDGWYKDQEALEGELKKVKDFYYQGIRDNGEDYFIRDADAKKRLDNMVSEFSTLNQASKNYTSNMDAILKSYTEPGMELEYGEKERLKGIMDSDIKSRMNMNLTAGIKRGKSAAEIFKRDYNPNSFFRKEKTQRLLSGGRTVTDWGQYIKPSELDENIDAITSMINSEVTNKGDFYRRAVQEVLEYASPEVKNNATLLERETRNRMREIVLTQAPLADEGHMENRGYAPSGRTTPPPAKAIVSDEGDVTSLMKGLESTSIRGVGGEEGDVKGANLNVYKATNEETGKPIYRVKNNTYIQKTENGLKYSEKEPVGDDASSWERVEAGTWIDISDGKFEVLTDPKIKEEFIEVKPSLKADIQNQEYTPSNISVGYYYDNEGIKKKLVEGSNIPANSRVTAYTEYYLPKGSNDLKDAIESPKEGYVKESIVTFAKPDGKYFSVPFKNVQKFLANETKLRSTYNEIARLKNEGSVKKEGAMSEFND